MGVSVDVTAGRRELCVSSERKDVEKMPVPAMAAVTEEEDGRGGRPCMYMHTHTFVHGLP
jgi:hypothetical protein